MFNEGRLRVPLLQASLIFSPRTPHLNGHGSGWLRVPANTRARTSFLHRNFTMREFPYPLAAIIPVEADLCAAVQKAAAAGFTRVELPALVDRPTEHIEALADSGVLVVCADLGVGLAAESLPARRSRLEQLRLQVAD